VRKAFSNSYAKDRRLKGGELNQPAGDGTQLFKTLPRDLRSALVTSPAPYTVDPMRDVTYLAPTALAPTAMVSAEAYIGRVANI
jgi:hypothetical protein